MKQLNPDYYNDLHENQVLETDIMRFMAVIGIVFWIIFALIKSMPLQVSQTPTALLHPAEQTIKKALPNQAPANPAQNNKNQSANRSSTVKSAQELSPGNKRANKQTSHAQRPSGVLMQFRSLEDLLELMAKHKVKLFCRARASGFDLFFEGISKGDHVAFKAARKLPPQLWQIKGGKAYMFFLREVGSAYPAIKTFPEKQVLVFFADKKLKKEMEATLASLQESGESGVLSITRDCTIIYQHQ